ncbi:ankyrin [Peniophora sp. CONT]|nr:ankyrin [Peniophora sp. CONT]
MIPITCNAVGDILALATLVLDIGRALNESRGSPSDYRTLVGELNSLNIVLSSVGRVSQLTADIDLRKEIVHEADRCGQDVQRALERIFKFSVLGRGNDRNDALQVKLKRQWYKLEWRFGHRSHIKEVRADLATATQRLAAYLVISNADGIQGLRVSISSQINAMTAQICTSFLEQFASAAVRDAELSRTVHSNAAALGELLLASRRPMFELITSRDGLDSSKAAVAALLCVVIFTTRNTSRPIDFALLLAAFTILMCSMARDARTMVSDVKYTQSNSITLNDAMGRRLVLPLELCETPELFHSTLVNLFSRTNGRWFIDAHRYELKTSSGRLLNCDRTGEIQSGTEIEIREPLSDTGNEAEPLLPWRNQVRGFTRFSLHRQLPHPTAFLFRSFEERSELHIAAENGQYARIAELLAQGEDVNSSTPSGLTALHLACISGSARIAELLLDYGAAIDAPTEDNVTPLAYTINYHQHETAALLVARGAMVHALESMRAAVLYTAACANNVDIMPMLLQLGLDVNAPFRGETALHAATRFRNRESIEMLLRNGANVLTNSQSGETPLSKAALYGDFELFELLRASGEMNNHPSSRASASEKDIGHVLHHAILGGNPSIVATVLQFTAANLNVRFEDGTTPLSLASEHGHDKVVETLLVQGVNPDVEALPPKWTGKKGAWNALHVAAYSGHAKCIKVLLQHGADVNARTEYGDTVLSLALERKHKGLKDHGATRFDEVLDVLVSCGAIADERSSLFMLDKITCLDGSSKNHPGFAVPGTWPEEARLESDSEALSD